MFKSPSSQSSKSFMASPKGRFNTLDDQLSNASFRASKSYVPEGRGVFGQNEATRTLIEKERRLDDQFRNLLDRCNRSKDYLDNIQKKNFIDKTKEQMSLLSPTSSSNMIPRSPTYSRGTPATRAIRELEGTNLTSRNGSALKQRHEHSRDTSFGAMNTEQYSNKNTNQNIHSDEYLQLESDIIGLKRTILEKLKSDEKQKRKNLGFSDDDDEDDYGLADQKTTSRLHSSKKSSTASILKNNHTTNSKNILLKENIRSKINNDDSDDDDDDEDKMTHNQENDDYDQIDYDTSTTEVFKKKIGKYGKAFNEKVQAEKSIKALEHTLQQKEKAYKDKYAEAKAKAKELKGVLREYVSKAIDLEDQAKVDKELIVQYEEQTRRDQDEIMRLSQIIDELKTKEDLLMRNEEEIRNTNVEYKLMLNEQKQKLDYYEDTVRETEDKSKSQTLKYQDELGDLKIENRVLKERNSSNSDRIEKLEEEVQGLREELSQKNTDLFRIDDLNNKKSGDLEKLQEQVKVLTFDNKDLKDALTNMRKVADELDAKVQKQKRKYEENKTQQTGELEKKVAQKKEKIRFLKHRVQDLESIANKALEEKKIMSIEVEKMNEDRNRMERELHKVKEDIHIGKNEVTNYKGSLDDLKMQNSELLRDVREANEKVQRLETQNRKLAKSIKGLEDKVSKREEDNKSILELNQKLKSEVKDLLEENNNSRQYISKVEEQNQYLQTRQEDEIMTVEQKIDSLSQEIIKIKEENAVLRTREEKYISDIDQMREDKDSVKKEYRSLKVVNRQLEKDLKIMNEKIRQIIQDRNEEIDFKENLEAKKTQTKIKVLDEIQDMIRNHRMTARSTKRGDNSIDYY